MKLWRIIAVCFALVGMASLALYTFAEAQDQEEAAERNAFVEFVERVISTPDRQIRLGQIRGALSSNVSFSEITIADRDGVWLRIENVRMVWSRAQLILGRLQIDELEADAIVMERRPLPPEDEIPEEARLTVPELPVAMNIGRLAVPEVRFGDDVFGLASQLSVEGRLRLADGDLDTELAIQRLDGPGGSLELTADFDSGAETLHLDFRLSEPEDGVVANLLDLQGRPALTFVVAGSGPLADFTADIELLADGETLLAGRSEIARVANGFRFVAEIDGRLGELAPPAYADLFGDGSTLAIDAIRTDDGAVSIARADLASGVMSLSASAELAPDGFPLAVSLDARLGGEDVEQVSLPFGDGVVVRSGHIVAEIGGADGESWSAEFDLQGLVSGTLTAEQATITAGGIARNRDDPQRREVTFDVDGSASGLTSGDPGIAAALGDQLAIVASGGWTAGEPVIVEEARIDADALAAHFEGRILDGVIDGAFRIASDDLSPFSRLAGQDLGGAVELAASGTLATDFDRFALTLDGSADDLVVGPDPLDRLFEGRTALSGGIGRDEAGFRFDDLILDHANVRARIDGVHGAEEVDVALNAELPDLSAVTDEAAGAARLEARMTGVAEVPALEVLLSGEALTLLDQPFADAEVRFVGTLEGRDLAGELSLSGVLGRVPVEGGLRVTTIDGVYELEDILFQAAGTTASGALTVRPDSLVSGALNVESPDLSVIGPLALTEMAGSVSADIRLSVVDDSQAGHLVATARNVRAGGFALGSADIDVTGENLRQAPILSGTVEAAGLVAGPIEIETLSATAERVGDRTEFVARARLTDGVVDATGRLVPMNGGLDIEFDTFELRDASINATLADPVAIAIRNGTVAIPSTRILVGGGSVVIAGRVGETIDLRGEIASLNVAVANAVAPGLGLSGSISGSLALSGPATAPRGTFELQGTGLSAAPLREAGLAAFSVNAQGRFADGSVDLQGTASGSGISLTLGGTVPLAGPGLDLAITGTAPLALSDLVLAERGARLAGTLSIDARVTGSVARPSFAGTLATDGATFVDADTGLRLTDIALRARFDADRVVVEQLTGRAGGGTVSAGGSVGIGGGFPADLAITLANFRYQDGRLITADLSGRLTVTGPLLVQPTVGGTIDIERAEISVPDRIPQAAAMLDVQHVAPSPAVAETLVRARLDEQTRAQQRTGLRLELTINAPARIFVRGRGIDSEFGGSVTLTGPVDAVRAIGAFNMRRGHITILGQRINFTSGSISLFGDLDPVLNFEATSRASNVAITAFVTGRASDPDIVLTSIPELPQDEIFAQFLFGRSVHELSPLQLAQLATAAAGLVGGADGGGLLGQLRGATGLDELDLVVGEEGGVAVQAGRYVADNVYLGVRAGADGETGVTVNLDITDNFTARGEVGIDGRSKVGIFFEREY